ncbi:MAG: hypothetical protein LBQ81_10420 [Zoogloeaceae bacterium]|nr:hypothetical protein [Zoogloeaceae bacterium]
MKKLLFLPLLALLLVFSASAHAARWKIGTDERIDFIATTGLQTEDGKPMSLGHMVSTEYFFVPYSIKGELVLTARGEDNTYYPLPEGEELAKFQQDGDLPDPLPQPELSIFDQLFGHLLWMVIPIFVLAAFLRKFFAKKEKQPEAA